MEFGWVVGWIGLWVQSFHFAMGWDGFGQSFGRLGWDGLTKLDPRTTLGCLIFCATLPGDLLGFCEFCADEDIANFGDTRSLFFGTRSVACPLAR